MICWVESHQHKAYELMTRADLKWFSMRVWGMANFTNWYNFSRKGGVNYDRGES